MKRGKFLKSLLGLAAAPTLLSEIKPEVKEEKKPEPVKDKEKSKEFVCYVYGSIDPFKKGW